MTTERVALLTYHLTNGEALSTFAAAELLQVTRQGAWAMLTRMARVIPIYMNDEGLWELSVMGEAL